MTTERFDIEVSDSVAKTIRTELKAIGGEARSTHGLVKQLNQELANGARAAASAAQTAAVQASGAAARTAAAQAKATAETARATAAQARLTGEQSKAAIAGERLAQAEAKTALAKQKVATEAAKTAAAQSKANIAYLNEEAALNRAVAAEQRAIQSKERLAAASATAAAASQRQTVIMDRNTVQQAAGGLGGNAGSRATASRQTEIMRGGSAGTSGVQDNSTALDANAGAAKRAATEQTNYGSKAQAAGNQSRLASHHALNLGFQLNDIVVSLISGQKPYMVAIQQGAQIAQINQQAGLSWKAMGMEMLLMTRILQRTTEAEAAAELAAASMAARNLSASAAIASANVVQADTEIALAMAQRETAATAAQTTAAEARLAAAHEAAAVAAAEQAVAERALSAAQGRQVAATTAANNATVTRLGAVGKAGLVGAVAAAAMAASLGALNREANKNSGLKKYTEEMGYSAKEVKKLNAVTVDYGDTAKAVFQVGLKRIAAALGLSAKEMKKQWKDAMDFMASATRATMAGIYAAVATARKAADPVGFAGILGKGKGNILTGMKEELKSNYDDAQKYFDDVIKQARVNARKGQDEMAEEMYNKPRTKKPKAEWDRAKEWRDANAELDVQIGMLGKYGDELERAQRLEQIGRTFREHNVPLTAKETKILEDKILALQEGSRVQQAMTAADEAANGPARAYAATQDALGKLLEANKITMAEYNRQLNLASRAFEDATDPLASMNRELETNARLMSSYGEARGAKEYLEQIRQRYEDRGESIYQQGPQGAANDNEIVVNGSRKLRPEVQTAMDEYRKQRKTEVMTSAFEQIDPRENQDVGSNSYLLDHHKEMYAEIQRMREEDVNNEQEANRRKRNLDIALKDARLETMSGMFSQLASLQGSHNRTVAALGKAAAIAQATIDGYRAVQSALAGPPGPPWSFAIAGVTAAMTVANVAKIAGVGFQRGGYTGDGNPGDVAGPAHRGEFVMDAAATRRLGVPALEALRSGRTFQPANDAAFAGPRVVIKPQPGVYVEERMTPTGDIELIAERVAKRVAPVAVAENIHQSPNGKVAKAIQTNYGVTRQRA